MTGEEESKETELRDEKSGDQTPDKTSSQPENNKGDTEGSQTRERDGPWSLLGGRSDREPDWHLRDPNERLTERGTGGRETPFHLLDKDQRSFGTSNLSAVDRESSRGTISISTSLGSISPEALNNLANIPSSPQFNLRCAPVPDTSVRCCITVDLRTGDASPTCQDMAHVDPPIEGNSAGETVGSEVGGRGGKAGGKALGVILGGAAGAGGGPAGVAIGEAIGGAVFGYVGEKMGGAAGGVVGKKIDDRLHEIRTKGKEQSDIRRGSDVGSRPLTLP